MSSPRQPERYVPKHRRPPAHRASRAAARTMFVLSSAAVVGTGAAVAGGTLSLSPADASGSDASAASAAQVAPAAAAVAAQADAITSSSRARADAETQAADEQSAARTQAQAEAEADARAEAERRVAPVSRSDRRGVADPRKQAALSLEVAQPNALTRSEDASDEDPRTIAETLLGDAGQFSCLDSLWTKESGWQVDADNPTSSAYGIPQALPGSKMSTFGDDWATNPVTQIRWGLDYIEDRYGSPCGAWSHSQSYNWY